MSLDDQLHSAFNKDALHRAIDAIPDEDCHALLIVNDSGRLTWTQFGKMTYADLVFQVELFKHALLSSES